MGMEPGRTVDLYTLSFDINREVCFACSAPEITSR